MQQQPSAKYSPIEVAQIFEATTTAAGQALAEAAKLAPSRTDPTFRRMEEDVRIQIGLGQFYSAKFRAGVLFEIYRRTGNAQAREQALAAYRKARAIWAAMAERARKVYVADLAYGEIPVRRGHWMDRLPAIDQDLAAVEAAHFEAAENNDHAVHAIAEATGRPARVSVKCLHNGPQGFQPGTAVPLLLTVHGAAAATARLHYRHVNHAERWQSLKMNGGGSTFQAMIPAVYTQSPFPLEYYFELRSAGASPTLYPGLDSLFANQPYFVLRRG